jgi:hypothetical protein
MTRSKKPDLTARRRLVARRSAATDFLIGLGGADAATDDADMGVDIGDAQGVPSEIGTAKSIDIRQIIKQAQKTRVPRDLKFDDSSMPDAANFYRWCTGSEFLNAEPYLEQVLIGVRLFGEYCPICSDTEWMKIENHEPQEGLAGMLAKVVLLEHGVCPKCKGRRSEFFRTNKLKFYNELGVNAGQRCVTGDQLLSTGVGLRRVRDLLPDAEYGENEVEGLTAALTEGPLKVNKIVRIEAGERLVCATLANGTEIKGTATHGIEGWAKSYRPLQDAAKSPVVIATNHHIGEPFPIREYAEGMVRQGALPENYSAKAIRNYAMMQTMAHAVMGTLLVHNNVPYVEGGPTLDTVFKSLTAGCYRDNKMVQLPDYLLSNAAPLLHTFFRTLFPDDEIGLSVMVDSEELAREIQALAIACGWPCMRDGHSLWLDQLAYNDFSELRETVLRVEPTFSAERWDRGSLASALENIEIDSPLYYLKRLVDGDYAVFNAAVADIEPEDTWTFEVPSGQRYMIDNIVCENSGKSVVVAMLSTYMTHRVLKMQKPTRVYGIGDNQILQGTFVALTQAQAKDTLWEPYFGYIVASPWFQRYHALIKRYESLYGVEVMKIRDTFVLYRHRNLIVFPAGPDKRTLRGRTRIFYAIDEIGWFDNDASKNKIKTGAAEVSIALERSCLTVRSAEGRLVASGNDMCYTAYGFNVSSPSDFRDKICEIVRQAETSNKILGIHAPTWKMNPNVTREMLEEEFRKNPIAAARDYGAQPPVSANPFISPGTVDECMRDVGRNEVVYNQATDRRSNGISVERTAYGKITKIKQVDRPSVLAMDAGETNNSFALSCMSLVNGIPSVDLLVEIMPSPGEPLNYTLIFDHIIVPMIKARNVKVLLADRWNSTKLLQDALALGLVQIAKKYSLKYNDMWDVKNQMQGGTFSYPRSQFVKSVIELLHDQDLTNYPACFANKPVEHFMYQCVTIQDSRNQVLKGVGLTDDLWRATALAAYGLNSPDYAPFLVNSPNRHIDRNPQRLGVIGSAKAVGTGSGAQARSGTIGNFTAVLSSRRAK